MTQAKWVIAFIALFSFTAMSAQQKKTPASQQRGTNDAGKTADEINRSQGNASDTASAAPAGEVNAASAKKSGNTTQTSGLMEHTSSPSGSPSQLSDDRGTGRDGTNNVQRATMNMAGSPVENIDLSKKPVDVNNEMSRDRNSVSATRANKESNQINENSRRENNDQSGPKPIVEESRDKDHPGKYAKKKPEEKQEGIRVVTKNKFGWPEVPAIFFAGVNNPHFFNRYIF